MEAPPALCTPPQRPRSSSTTICSGGSIKQINSKVLHSDLPEGLHLTKEQLGLLLAMWAQNKPDCLYQHKALYKRIREYKKWPKKDQDNIIPAANTGTTLINSNNMIMAMAGSGATHVVAYLCNRFPQLRGHHMCVKMPLQLLPQDDDPMWGEPHHCAGAESMHFPSPLELNWTTLLLTQFQNVS